MDALTEELLKDALERLDIRALDIFSKHGSFEKRGDEIIWVEKEGFYLHD